jgi:hypothetical protein
LMDPVWFRSSSRATVALSNFIPDNLLGILFRLEEIAEAEDAARDIRMADEGEEELKIAIRIKDLPPEIVPLIMEG